MNESFHLGRVAGIRVGANWTVLVIFLLVFGGLAGGRFPLLFPDEPTGVYIAAGGIAAIVFFLSLLAHETAHALVAQRNGVEVDGIVLWMFGGVAQLRGEAPNPGAELRIAGVGPLVSLLLAGSFGAVSLLLREFGVEGIVFDVVLWLAIINAALAVFNLVPAAPLDGGRLLRAVLWMQRGDRTSAAVTAARAGRVFGLILVGVGLAELILVPGIAGLWFMLIGWFVMGAAGVEEQHAQLQQRIGDLRVRSVMSPDPLAVRAGTTVQQVLDHELLRHRFSTFPVIDDEGRPLGLLTLNRMKRVPAEQRASTRVETVACPVEELPEAAPDLPLIELLPRLRGGADGRALVIEDGRLVGIVSPTDVARSIDLAELGIRIPREHV